MIKVDKNKIIISEGKEVLTIFFNQKLTLKERICALTVTSSEECKELILQHLWRMSLKEFPLNIWEKIKDTMYNCENFQFVYKKGHINNHKENYTFSASKVYINKIK